LGFDNNILGWHSLELAAHVMHMIGDGDGHQTIGRNERFNTSASLVEQGMLATDGQQMFGLLNAAERPQTCSTAARKNNSVYSWFRSHVFSNG
jgi:hypothetical protein